MVQSVKYFLLSLSLLLLLSACGVPAPSSSEAQDAIQGLIGKNLSGSVEVAKDYTYAKGTYFWTIRIVYGSEKAYFCLWRNSFDEWEADLERGSYKGFASKGECPD